MRRTILHPTDICSFSPGVSCRLPFCFAGLQFWMICNNSPCRAQQLQQQVKYKLNVHQIHKPATGRRPAASTAAAPAAEVPQRAAAATVRPISRQASPLEPATGYVPREANAAHVPGSFQQLLDNIVAAYQAACGPRLAGVYLRGSLPRGLFLPGISDVDTFAVVLPTTTASGMHINSSSNGATNGRSSSTDSSLHDLQQAVQRLSTPVVQDHQHLGYTKVGRRLVRAAVVCRHTNKHARVALVQLQTRKHKGSLLQVFSALEPVLADRPPASSAP